MAKASPAATSTSVSSASSSMEEEQAIPAAAAAAAAAAPASRRKPPAGESDDEAAPGVMKSAPPPAHAVSLMAAFAAAFVRYLPALDDVDRVATVDTFASRAFPGLLSLRSLGLIRLGFAVLIFGTSVAVALGDGWWQETAYLPSSKLRRVRNRIRGLRTLAPFTSVAWNLLGAAFALSGYVALAADHHRRSSEGRDTGVPVVSHVVSPWTLRAALVLWEIAAPFTLLVSAVIRYAIWPRLIATNGATVNLKTLRNVLMHNANVLMATTEIALLGGLPVLWRHVSLAPLVGCAYVVWSWSATGIWNGPEHGPQYIYFFFDTTLGAKATWALVILLAVMMAFYSLMVAAESLLESAGGGLTVHALFVAVVCGSVMRFRD